MNLSDLTNMIQNLTDNTLSNIKFDGNVENLLSEVFESEMAVA
jgi:hypothetical protein